MDIGTPTIGTLHTGTTLIDTYPIVIMPTAWLHIVLVSKHRVVLNPPSC